MKQITIKGYTFNFSEPFTVVGDERELIRIGFHKNPLESAHQQLFGGSLPKETAEELYNVLELQ